jgi:hypothetical protein
MRAEARLFKKVVMVVILAAKYLILLRFYMTTCQKSGSSWVVIPPPRITALRRMGVRALGLTALSFIDADRPCVTVRGVDTCAKFCTSGG